MKGVQTAFCLLPSSYIELTISRKHPWQYFSIILLSLILYSQRLKLENKNTTSCLTCNENENSCSHSSCVKTHTTNLWELHKLFFPTITIFVLIETSPAPRYTQNSPSTVMWKYYYVIHRFIFHLYFYFNLPIQHQGNMLNALYSPLKAPARFNADSF